MRSHITHTGDPELILWTMPLIERLFRQSDSLPIDLHIRSEFRDAVVMLRRFHVIGNVHLAPHKTEHHEMDVGGISPFHYGPRGGIRAGETILEWMSRVTCDFPAPEVRARYQVSKMDSTHIVFDAWSAAPCYPNQRWWDDYGWRIFDRIKDRRITILCWNDRAYGFYKAIGATANASMIYRANSWADALDCVGNCSYFIGSPGMGSILAGLRGKRGTVISPAPGTNGEWRLPAPMDCYTREHARVEFETILSKIERDAK